MNPSKEWRIETACEMLVMMADGEDNITVSLIAACVDFLSYVMGGRLMVWGPCWP